MVVTVASRGYWLAPTVYDRHYTRRLPTPNDVLRTATFRLRSDYRSASLRVNANSMRAVLLALQLADARVLERVSCVQP